MMKTIFLSLLASVTFFCATAFGQVDPLAGYASSIEVRRAHAMDRVFDARYEPGTRREVTLDGRYLERRIDQEAERDTDGYGVRGAVGWSVPNTFLEFSIDYQDLTSDFLVNNPDEGEGEVETRSVTFALSSEIVVKKWRLLAQGGYGRSDYDARRSTVTGRKDATYEGDDTFATLSLDRSFAAQDGFLFRPFVAVSGSWVNLETFSERADGPAGADARTIFGDRYEEYLGYGGIGIEKKGEQFSPSVSIARVQRLGSYDFTFKRVDMRSGDPRPGEEETVQQPYDGLWVVDLRLPVKLGGNWSVVPGARYARGSDDERWHVGVSAACTF